MEQKKIEENRLKIIKLLKSTNREGMDNVLDFLDKSEFYTREGSEDRHHPFKGGLAQHSLNTYSNALFFNRGCAKDSIIICSLLHDICKVSHRYTTKECFYGHGSRSINILDYLQLKLKDDERRAIRFHKPSTNRKFSGQDAEEFEIAQEEKLRNLICRSIKIDTDLKNKFKSKLLRLVSRV